MLLFPLGRSSESSVRAVKEKSAVRTEVLAGSFLRRPTLAEGGLDPVAAEASVVEAEEEMPNAKREVVVLAHFSFLVARCGVQLVPNAAHSHLGQSSEVGNWNKGRADQFGVDTVLIGPLRNVYLSHEDRAALFGLQRVLLQHLKHWPRSLRPSSRAAPSQTSRPWQV